jgi:4,5-dihydroxyphthalate decarboxylase
MPLACGDVRPEGIDLELDRRTDIKEFLVDPSFHAGEMSFSQYLIRTAQGERGFVGLPVFLMRGYRHRCLFVRRDSKLASLDDLAGKRIGTNGWPDTGNTWSRAALRDQGVGIETIDWWVGPVDDPAYDSFGRRPELLLPANVRRVPAGHTLQGLLLAGELDAVMCPWPPARFYEQDSPVVRLFPEYWRVEQQYARRVGFVPGFHILALRREAFERHPWVGRSLFEACEQARVQAAAHRRWLADASPWALADIEATTALLGEDWQAHGVTANRRMIETFCQEVFGQGLVSSPLDQRAILAQFEQTMRGDGDA